MPSLPSTTSFHETTSVCGKDLMDQFLVVAHGADPTWSAPHRKIRLLGSGGQGVVYLGERCGTDCFALPVALKFFSPQYHSDADDYVANMQQVARIAARVALIQHGPVAETISTRSPQPQRLGRPECQHTLLRGTRCEHGTRSWA